MTDAKRETWAEWLGDLSLPPEAEGSILAALERQEAEIERLNGVGDYPEIVGLLRGSLSDPESNPPLTQADRDNLANVLVGNAWTQRRLMAERDRLREKVRIYESPLTDDDMENAELRAEIDRLRAHESEVADAVAHDIVLLVAAQDALDRVKALHVAGGPLQHWCSLVGGSMEDDHGDKMCCDSCGPETEWPCETVSALVEKSGTRAARPSPPP